MTMHFLDSILTSTMCVLLIFSVSSSCRRWSFDKPFAVIVAIIFDVLPHVIWVQLCQLSPVDAHNVALKPLMGK